MGPRSMVMGMYRAAGSSRSPCSAGVYAQAGEQDVLWMHVSEIGMIPVVPAGKLLRMAGRLDGVDGEAMWAIS